jgi:hypothetical protein
LAQCLFRQRPALRLENASKNFCPGSKIFLRCGKSSLYFALSRHKLRAQGLNFPAGTARRQSAPDLPETISGQAVIRTVEALGVREIRAAKVGWLNVSF